MSTSTPRPRNFCGSPNPRRQNSASGEPRTANGGRREGVVSDDLQVPARHTGDGREWPRVKPVFSVLAMLLALVGGAFQFAFQFKRHWTPLQRLYFSVYFQTAHLAHSSNRNLRPPRVVPLLLVAFPRGARLAVDGDVTETPTATGEPASPTDLMLSPAARQAGATRLAWQPMRMDD